MGLARAHALRNFIKTFRFYQNLESDQEGGKETGFMYTRNFSVKPYQKYKDRIYFTVLSQLTTI